MSKYIFHKIELPPYYGRPVVQFQEKMNHEPESWGTEKKNEKNRSVRHMVFSVFKKMFNNKYKNSISSKRT